MLCNIALYSIGPYFYHQSHPQLGSPVNPTNLANTFKSVKRLNNITDKTIDTYIGYLTDAFMIEKADRYDIKGKKYIGTTPKYYFKDLGLRNAILSFRQTEENHLMENVIFNEMRHRGFLVDVGNVNVRIKNEKGEWQRATLEVDFVCNLGSRKYYLQSAFRMPDEEKMAQEKRSLLLISDSFRKIVIIGERMKLRRDNFGIVLMGISSSILPMSMRRSSVILRTTRLIMMLCSYICRCIIACRFTSATR